MGTLRRRRAPIHNDNANDNMRSSPHRRPGHGTRFIFSAPGGLPMGRRSIHLALALALGAGAASGVAAQGVDWTLTGGAATERSVKKLGVIAGWTRPEPLWQGEQWRLRLRHEAELSAWDVPKAKNLIEAGYSPVIRLEHPLAGGSIFFVEGSIGVRLLSHTRVAPDHRLSTAFQFSDQVGMGIQWGRDAQSTLGLRYQHLSNAGIKNPNPGMDFVRLYYTYRF